MYDTRYAPDLELKRTISHPIEQVKVVGFEGRDTTYGRDAVVLKGESVPKKQVRDGDHLKNTIAIPENVRNSMEEEKRFLYVLQSARVDAVGPDAIADTETYTFETDYGDVEFKALKLEDFTTFSRESVEVSLP